MKMRGQNTSVAKPMFQNEYGTAGEGYISEQALYSFITDEDDKTMKQKSQDPAFFDERQLDLKQRMKLKEQQLEEKRKRFLSVMKQNLEEDREGNYELIQKSTDKKGLDATGQLTQDFIDDLREFKEEEMLRLEESIKNARQPAEDMFGIKRRFCKVCEKGCIGYEPINMLVPNLAGAGGSLGEFPTFCKNCKCPAYFHQVVVDVVTDIVFPPELSETVKNYNITSKDVNYNAVVALFQIRDTERYQNNLSELMTILKEEGLEILQLEKRDLDIEEAIYIKARMIGQAETEFTKLYQGGFSVGVSGGRGNRGGSNIRQEVYQGSSMQTMLGQKDPYIMNQYADEKEHKIQKLQQTMMGQKTNQNIQYADGVIINNHNKNRDTSNNQRKQVTFKDHHPNQKSQHQGQVLMDTINQRVNMDDKGNSFNNTLNSRADSIARTSNLDGNSLYNYNTKIDPLAYTKRETVLPAKKDKKFKMKIFSKSSTQVKKALNTYLRYQGDLAMQETLMTQQIEDNPFLKELITKEVLIIAVGSTTFQNLDRKLKTQVLPKIQQFVPPYEMPMLYLSDNKILALEDSITFFPSMFKLTKSIVVSEQLAEFNNFQGDISNFAEVQLKQTNINSAKFNEKLKELMGEITEGDQRDVLMEDPNRDTTEEMEENEDEGFYRNRKTLARKISSQLKETIVKRETIRQAQMSGKFQKTLDALKQMQRDGDEKEETLLDWIQKSKQFEASNKKKQRLLTKKNKVIYNFGVMHDFFNYSAMKIQSALQQVDIDQQTLLTATQNYQQMQKEGMSQLKANKNLSNVYAIGKVGLSNMILPSGLDVKLSIYNNYVSFMRMSDIFFPELSHSQFSVLLLRPVIVKNGLNDVFVQILKVNDFTIIKRKIRMLTKSEVLYLARVERITKDKADLYYNLMMDSDCEIIVVSKIGAVEDLQTIVDGGKPYGRRRVPQLNEEEKSGVRANVDSINGMFEISPFTSFSEFIDLEDFIVGHSRLEKYKKLYQRDSNLSSQLENQLYYYKIDQIRRELNLFQRFFNISALAAPTQHEAQRAMCVLMPEVATIEESVVILNPIYNTYKQQAVRLLERMGFKIVRENFHKLSREQVENIFHEKMSTDYKQYSIKLRETLADQEVQDKIAQKEREKTGAAFVQVDANSNTLNRQSTYNSQNLKTMVNGNDKLSDLLVETQVYMFHICKVAGDREIRQLYQDSQIEYEDLFKRKCKTTPFRPNQFPFLFLFMDTPNMFEQSLPLIYPYNCVELTGQDMQDDKLSSKEKIEIVNNILKTTVGDEIKYLYFDKEGQILNGKKSKEEISQSLNTTEEVAQLFQFFSNPRQGNHQVHFLVESEGHGLYELRFQRLPHKGDFYSEANDETKVNIGALRQRYFTRFQSLNFYYNEVNKKFYNVCPAFYRFRICPLHAAPPEGVQDKINRVYEVEEYMGKLFIDDLANQHQDHVKMLKSERKLFDLQQLTNKQQKSLPPYIWGVRLGQMCKDLEKIVPTKATIDGAGKLKFDKGQLRGITQNPNEYFAHEKKRYEKILEQFKLGWGYYLNVLEQDLIEEKLKHILDSYTFKHSRQPGMLALIPDRVSEVNLRISEKLKFVIPESLQETVEDKRNHTLKNKEKFFTHLKQDLVNENTEKERSSQVQSILHTLHVSSIKKSLDLMKKEAALEAVKDVKTPQTKFSTIKQDQTEDPNKKEFSIHKDVAIVGCEVAIRTKYQLVASILYLFNFWYRNIERRTEFFQDLDRNPNPFYMDKNSDGVNLAERDYDQVLDIIVKSIQENYGDDEYNLALDMARLNKEEESDFERGMRERKTQELKRLEKINQRIYEQHRLQRTTMSIKDLIHKECNVPQRVYEEEQRKLLKKFIESRGQYDSAGEGFLQALKQMEVFLGPYSIKLAHEYLRKFETEEKTKQEKISFVKMEYFLLGVQEAHRTVEELKAMEGKLARLMDEVDFIKRQLGFDDQTSLAQKQYYNSLQERMGSTLISSQDNPKLKAFDLIDTLNKRMENIRDQIAVKESELVLSLRELVQWDYMAPDHYFDSNQLLTLHNQRRNESYTVPFKTFWLPITIDRLWDPLLTRENFAKNIRNYVNAERIPLKSLYGQDLSGMRKIAEEAKKDENGNDIVPASEKEWGYQEGVMVSYLRPYNNREPSDYLKFDKYFSLGEWKQYQEIIKIRDLIKEKTSKTKFTYGGIFKK